MKIYSVVAIALLALNPACTSNAPSCADHFVNGEPPAFINANLGKQSRQLCFEGYAVLHSGVSRTPIWAAEHLTAERIDHAKPMKRHNTFHAEEQLPPAERAELRDYVRSGFDRGHMAPSGDMPTETAQYQSFSLANMVPQNSNNNQNLWEGIEEATRSLARKDGEVYVVSGPLFEGSSLERINGRVLVPTSIFKAVYDPARQQAGAYVTPNTAGMEYQTQSIDDLDKRSGINMFPALPAQIKQIKMKLPAPTPHRSRKRQNAPTEIESSTE